MNRIRTIVLIIGSLFLIEVHAAYLSGTVEYLQIDPASGGLYVRLAGTPTFDGGGCQSIWVRGALDDQNIIAYVWPALMNAKNHGKPVTINANGCSGIYPKIDWVQVNP